MQEVQKYTTYYILLKDIRTREYLRDARKNTCPAVLLLFFLSFASIGTFGGTINAKHRE